MTNPAPAAPDAALSTPLQPTPAPEAAEAVGEDDIRFARGPRHYRGRDRQCAIVAAHALLHDPRMVFSRSTLERQLRDGIDALALTLPPGASRRLLDYLELLARWNASFNLTAVRKPADMVTRHLLDALAIAPYVTGTRATDLGSGAGVPGLVLAIAAPERDWWLVDSNGKKARFLRAVVRELKLDNVRVAQQRVQDIIGPFDCITTRAFASLADMLTWGGHLLAPGGQWLAMKGQRPDAELAALPAGFILAEDVRLAVPGLDAARHLLIVRRDGS